MRNASIALIVVTVAVIGGDARAATRVAVAPFEGDRTGDIRDTVVEMLEQDYRVLPVRDVELGMRKLDFEDGVSTKKEMAKLAAELDADAVVVGTVEPDGNKTKLKIRMYVKKSKRAFQFSTRYQKASQVRESSLADDLRAKLGPGGGRSIGNGDDAAVDDGDDGGRERSGKRSLRRDDDDDDRGADRRDDDRGDDEDGDRKRSARLSDDDEDIRDDAEDRDDDDTSVRKTAFRRTARKAAVRAEVGMAGSARQLTFISNLSEDDAPPTYKSNLVPAFRFNGELYPLAFTMPDSLASGLGIAGSFEQAVSLSTTVNREGQDPVTLPTTSKFWSVGARFRIAWGNRAMNPSFTLMFDYSHRDFTFDRDPLMGVPLDVPNIGYRMIGGGLGARIPLHPTFALLASARGNAPLETGGIGKVTEYGQAKMLGIDVEAGMEILIGRYIVLHLGGMFTQYGFSYSEATAGEKATNRDGDPDDLDVGGARDRYFGGMGTIGVAY